MGLWTAAVPNSAIRFDERPARPYVVDEGGSEAFLLACWSETELATLQCFTARCSDAAGNRLQMPSNSR